MLPRILQCSGQTGLVAHSIWDVKFEEYHSYEYTLLEEHQDSHFTKCSHRKLFRVLAWMQITLRVQQVCAEFWQCKWKAAVPVLTCNLSLTGSLQLSLPPPGEQWQMQLPRSCAGNLHNKLRTIGFASFDEEALTEKKGGCPVNFKAYSGSVWIFGFLHPINLLKGKDYIDTEYHTCCLIVALLRLQQHKAGFARDTFKMLGFICRVHSEKWQWYSYLGKGRRLRGTGSHSWLRGFWSVLRQSGKLMAKTLSSTRLLAVSSAILWRTPYSDWTKFTMTGIFHTDDFCTKVTTHHRPSQALQHLLWVTV